MTKAFYSHATRSVRPASRMLSRVCQQLGARSFAVSVTSCGGELNYRCQYAAPGAGRFRVAAPLPTRYQRDTSDLRLFARAFHDPGRCPEDVGVCDHSHTSLSVRSILSPRMLGKAGFSEFCPLSDIESRSCLLTTPGDQSLLGGHARASRQFSRKPYIDAAIRNYRL